MRRAIAATIASGALVLSTGCNDSVQAPEDPIIHPQFDIEDPNDPACITDPTCEPNVAFAITEAFVQYKSWIRTTEAVGKTTHVANWAGSEMVMNRDGATGTWTLQLDHFGKNLVNVLNTTGPCSAGSDSDASVHFSGSWTAAKPGLHVPPVTDQTTSYAQIQVCAVRRDEEQPYAGGSEEEPPGDDGPTTCAVRIWYWIDTGEIISLTVLYCY